MKGACDNYGKPLGFIVCVYLVRCCLTSPSVYEVLIKLVDLTVGIFDRTHSVGTPFQLAISKTAAR